MNRLRVALVIAQLGFGGAENQVVQLASRLRGRGHLVFVVSMIEPSALKEELVAASVPLIVLGFQKGKLTMSAILAFRKSLEALQPQIVHGFGFPANMLSRLVGRFSRVPVIVSTGVGTLEMAERFKRIVGYRLTDCLSDITTHVSMSSGRAAAEAGAVPARRLRIIPCGVDSVLFAPRVGKRHSRNDGSSAIDRSFIWLAIGRPQCWAWLSCSPLGARHQ